jgi:hypothetical protein
MIDTPVNPNHTAAVLSGGRVSVATRQLPWRRMLVATLSAAVGDAAFAFVAYVLVAGRYNFETLLQYIASGLVGKAAFASGWSGVGYAAFGFAIHVALAAAFVAVYTVVLAPVVHSRPAAVIIGLVYGAGIWLFMNAVVLRLGRSTQERFFNGYYTAFLIDHALLVGLPIALVLLATGSAAVRKR